MTKAKNPKPTRLQHTPKIRRVQYGGVPVLKLEMPCSKQFLLPLDLAYALGRNLVGAALDAKQETRFMRPRREHEPLATETHS